METHRVKRFCQTSEFNCGPYALAQLLSFYQEKRNGADIEKDLKMIKDLGIDGSCLGSSAISYGYKARMVAQDLYIFDPQWFKLPQEVLLGKLREFYAQAKKGSLKISIGGYIDFLEKGGRVEFNPLSKELIIDRLKNHPVLIGFCMTYLYGEKRPNDSGRNFRYNHFAVINGYDSKSDSFSVVDPYHLIPFAKSGRYRIKSDKLVAAMYLAEANNECTLLEIWK